LLSHTLYQLLNYSGGAASTQDGKDGAGRSFTVRNGIIGRAWRCNRCYVTGSLASDPYFLQRDYGYTESEAESTEPKSFFMGHVIRSDENQGSGDEKEDDILGILFLDIEDYNDSSGKIFKSISKDLINEIKSESTSDLDTDEIEEGREEQLICYSDCGDRTSNLAKEINTGLEEMGIPKSLSSIEDELSPTAPRIGVHDTY
jgi:hypothetical protein